MENEQQPSATPQAPSEQAPLNVSSRKPTINRALLIVLGFVLVGAVGYGSYSYGTHKSKKSSSVAQPTTDVRAQNVSDASNQAADASFHTVTFGSLDRAPKVSIQLAFPQNYQAIASDNGPNSFRSLFGDDSGSVTYDGGNWDLGNPEDGDGQSWGYIGIMGIAPDWYGRNGFASYGGFNGDSFASDPINATINGYDFSTTKQKKDSLNRLISDTSNCAKDSARGFTVSGGFNICYKPVLIRQAYASYNPRVELNGYASIKGTPYVLFGSVNIRGGLDGYKDDALDKAGNDFKAGKIPAPTQKNIDSFVEAFKHSSVASK